MSEYVELNLGGKTYRAAPCGFDLELAAEQKLHELREREFQRAIRLCAGQPEDVQRAVAREAIGALNSIVSRERVRAWMESPSGSVFSLWFHIQKAFPGFTLAEAETLMAHMGKREWNSLNIADAVYLGIDRAVAEKALARLEAGNG